MRGNHVQKSSSPKAASSRKPRKSAKPRRRPRHLWRTFFFIVVGLTTLTAATGVSFLLGLMRSLPPIEKLEYYEPPEATRVFDRTGSMTIGEIKNKDLERRQVVRIDEIPLQLRNAFIAIEDRRFYSHFGVDILGILRAFIENIKSGHWKEGASTITQQMTRNVLDKEIGNKKTIQRKIKEALYSLKVERRYSKDQILEFYLNQIKFGQNVAGVWAAADRYFSKDLSELTLAECATLAAIPKGTTAYNPIQNPKNALERRNQVLKRMAKLSMIDKDAYKAAKKEPLVVRRGANRAASRYPSFLSGLELDLRTNYGLSRNDLEQKGLRITTSIDPAIQDACVKALRENLVKVELKWQSKKPARHEEEMKKHGNAVPPDRVRLMEIQKVDQDVVTVRLGGMRGKIPIPSPLPFYNKRNIFLKPGAWLDVRINTVNKDSGEIKGEFADKNPVQGSLVVLNARTAEVLAMVGGTNFSNAAQGWNYAMQGGRQPGSTFKPFIYAAALEKGFSPNEVIVDEPIEFSNGNLSPYKPINYEKRFDGPMTLIRALEHSRNVVTIRLFEALGIKKALDIVRRFDFTSDARRHWNIPPQISVCLGTTDCSPFQLAAAYQVFANLGVGIRPRFFLNLVNAEGRIPVALQEPEEKQIVNPITAYQMQYLLRQVVLTGTGQQMIGKVFPSPPSPPVCGKTGTTNECIDAWFAGFTPDLVLVCQVGFDRRCSLGPRMTGSAVAGPIWRDAFKEILKTRKNWRMTFDAPDGIELANICSKTGKLVSDFCRENPGDHHIFLNVPFARGKAPKEFCDGSIRAPLIAPLAGEYASYASLARFTGYAHVPTTPYAYETDSSD